METKLFILESRVSNPYILNTTQYIYPENEITLNNYLVLISRCPFVVRLFWLCLLLELAVTLRS